jgi:hypothetical protein
MWARFETQDEIQARVQQEVAEGMAIFWSTTISSAIATGGRVFMWGAELLLEDALGVPLINSPDDLGKQGNNLQTTTARQATRKSPSQILGENMENAGIIRPANSAAHHIVAEGSTNSFAQQTRQILQREGIDINDASNGVFLPKNSKFANPPMSTHSVIHTNKYYENVFNRLNSVEPGKVKNELQTIAKELEAGTFEY